jgi:hypothetical protein
MGKTCTVTRPARDWTKEEIIAYIDFSEAEDIRVEANVAMNMASEHETHRRGMQSIWEAAEEDLIRQNALYNPQ